MKTPRLTPIVHALTLGEFASAVLRSPCTIQGCRPNSVRHQPASAAMNGRNDRDDAAQRNQRVGSRRLRQ